MSPSDRRGGAEAKAAPVFCVRIGQQRPRLLIEAPSGKIAWFCAAKLFPRENRKGKLAMDLWEGDLRGYRVIRLDRDGRVISDTGGDDSGTSRAK